VIGYTLGFSFLPHTLVVIYAAKSSEKKVESHVLELKRLDENSQTEAKYLPLGAVSHHTAHLLTELGTDHPRNSQFLLTKTPTTQRVLSTKWRFARPKPFISWSRRSESVVC
jgi:hypothetical protein